MDEKQKKETSDKKKKLNLKIDSLNIDKREYQEIVMSNSNFPDKNYSSRNYDY